MGCITKEELNKIGFKSLGENILISDKCSIYSPEKISIGSNVRIDDFSILSGDLKIGSYIHIAAGCYLYGGESGIEMMDFSGLSSRVSIYAASDDYTGKSLTNPTVPEKYKRILKGKVTIEKHVIIGSSTVILPRLTIREGASVGAQSLVIKNCEEWMVYFGSPAIKLKERKKDLLKLEKEFLREKGGLNGK